MKKIILIGGAPTIGKTYLAKKLSKKLGIPWISTDNIRDIMRETADKKKFPVLFKNHPILPAEKFLNMYSPSQVVKYATGESRDIWQGVRAFIKTDYSLESFIVEGISILPSLVSRDFKNDKRIKPIFLVNDNIEQIRRVVFTRGLYDDADKYSDEVKEKEVQWAAMFNSLVEKEAKKYGYPVYKIKKLDYPLGDVLRVVK